MSTVAFIRRCLDAGMDMDTALIAAEAFEAEAPRLVPALTPRQQRNRRYYENNRLKPSETSESKTPETNSDAPLSLPPSPQTPQPPTHTRKELTTRGKRPSRRCPEGWEPTGKTRAVLIGEGYEAGDLERALTRMRDHEFKTARSDWDATFRNWVRQDADRKPRQANERPDPATAKFDAKQANYARAWEGADRAARSRWEP